MKENTSSLQEPSAEENKLCPDDVDEWGNRSKPGVIVIKSKAGRIIFLVFMVLFMLGILATLVYFTLFYGRDEAEFSLSALKVIIPFALVVALFLFAGFAPKLFRKKTVQTINTMGTVLDVMDRAAERNSDSCVPDVTVQGVNLRLVSDMVNLGKDFASGENMRDLLTPIRKPFCLTCEFQLEADMNFCPNCGTPRE